MTKLAGIVALLLVTVSSSQCQLVKRIYSRTALYTANKDTVLNKAAVLTNGAFAIAGTEDGESFVAWHSRSGTLLGKEVYPGAGGRGYRIEKLVPRSDGGVFVVGEFYDLVFDPDYSVFVASYDSHMNKEWSNTFKYTSAFTCFANDAALGPNNSIYIVGSGRDINGLQSFAAMALTVSGATLYNVAPSYSSNSPASLNCLHVFSDSTALVGGQNSAGKPTDMVLDVNVNASQTQTATFTTGPYESVCITIRGYTFTGAAGEFKTTISTDGVEATVSGSDSLWGGSKVMTVPGGSVRAGDSGTGNVKTVMALTPNTGSPDFGKWIREFTVGSTTFEKYADSAADAYGESYILGATATNNTLADAKYFLCKTNSAGGARWTELWQPIANKAFLPGAMAIHPASGDILVVGNQSDKKNIGFAIYRQSPIALADLYVLPKNTVGYVSPRTVTNNDRFWQGSAVSLVTGPTHGTLNLSANGTFTYTPNTNFVGNDTWSYRLTKALVGTTTATVTMSVRNP